MMMDWSIFTSTACQYVSLVAFILGFFMAFKSDAKLYKFVGTLLCILAIGAMVIKYLVEEGVIH